MPQRFDSMEITVDSVVCVSRDATNYNGGALPLHITNLTWRVKSVVNDRCVLGASVSNPNIILNIPVHRKYLTLVQ